MTEQQTTRHHEHHEEHARRCHPGSRRPGARKSAKVHLVKWAPNNLCPPHSHCVRSGQCPDICPGTACADTVAVLTSAHSAVLTPPWPTIAMRMPVQFTVVFVSHFLYVQPPVLRVTYVPPFLPPPPSRPWPRPPPSVGTYIMPPRLRMPCAPRAASLSARSFIPWPAYALETCWKRVLAQPLVAAS